MEMQQMLERLLAGQAIFEEKVDDNRKAYQEIMDSNQEKLAADKEDFLARMEAIFDDNRKKVEADKEEMLARIKEEDRQANEELSTRMDARFGAYEKSIVACLGQAEVRTEKIERDTEMMQSAEEHQDVPSEDVAVMPVKGLMKRCRG
jgi:formiminotetrahydrofolate cyclodeaminase